MSIIKGTEVVEKGIFDEYVKGAKEALEVTTQLEKIAKGALKSDGAKIDLIKPDSLKSIQQFNKLLQDSNKQIIALEQIEKKKLETSIALERLEKQRLTTQQQDIRNKSQLEKLEQDSLRTKKAKLDLEIKEQKELERLIKLEERETKEKKKALELEEKRAKANKVYVGSIEELRNKSKLLRQERNRVNLTTEEGQKRLKEINRELDANNIKIEQNVSQLEQQKIGIGRYEKALGGIKKALAFVGIGVGIAEIGKKFFALNKEFRVTERLTKTLFGNTSANIKQVTKDAITLGKAYDQDVNEVLRTANTVSKQFGTSASASLSLIEEGIKKGADANGQFLDNLREYAPLLELAGLTADESIAIITQQVKEGVFSDKGVDAIKEATLSLREMTPATVEALNAIGLSSANIQKEIKAGTKTYFDVIQDISKKTKEFGEDSQEAGLILADVFKGAGEDAGDFIFKLDELSTSLEDNETVLNSTDETMISLSKNWNSFLTNLAEGRGVLGSVFSYALEFVDDLAYSLKRLTQTDEDRENILISERETKQAKERVEDFNAFVKRLGADEKRSRTELAKSFLAEDIARINQLKSIEQKSEEERLAFAKANGIARNLVEDGYFKIYLKGLESGVKAVKTTLLEVKKTGEEVKPLGDDGNKQKELTYLAKLKNDLKDINDSRESLLTKDSDQYANEFKKATEEAKKLKQEIQELEDILNGKTSSTSVNDSDDNSPFARQKAKIVEIDVAETEAQDKRVEREKQRIANAKKTYQNLNSVADAFAQRSQQRSEARQEEIDREIAVSQSRADAIRKIAEEGNISAQQSLAVEQQRQAEATLQKEKEIQKQKQIEAGLAMLKTYTAELEQGKKPLEALGSSALIGTAIASMISALPSFDVGSDNTSKGMNSGNGVDGKGGFLAINHPNEKIFKEEHAKAIGLDVPNSEVVDVFTAHKKGLLTPKVTVNSWQSSSQVLTKFEELNNSVKNLTKVTQTTERYDFDNLTNTLVKTVKSGNSVKNTHSKKSVLW